MKLSAFTKYLIPVSIKLQQKKTINIKKKKETKGEEKSTSGLLNLLKSSINKSELNWVSTGLKKQFEENLDKSLKLFDGNYKKIVK